MRAASTSSRPTFAAKRFANRRPDRVVGARTEHGRIPNRVGTSTGGTSLYGISSLAVILVQFESGEAPAKV